MYKVGPVRILGSRLSDSVSGLSEYFGLRWVGLGPTSLGEGLIDSVPGLYKVGPKDFGLRLSDTASGLYRLGPVGFTDGTGVALYLAFLFTVLAKDLGLRPSLSGSGGTYRVGPTDLGLGSSDFGSGPEFFGLRGSGL